MTHSKKDNSDKLDKSSLRLLWMTIIPSIFLGVYLGSRGIGYIATGSYTISLSGLVLIVLGLVIRWTAVMTLKSYFTSDVSIKDDHQLVNRGLYKVIRHPAYTGSLLSFVGLGLTFSNWLSTLVIFVPITLAFLYRIRIEEQALIAHFGDEYVQYCGKTKRLIPGIY